MPMQARFNFIPYVKFFNQQSVSSWPYHVLFMSFENVRLIIVIIIKKCFDRQATPHRNKEKTKQNVY